MRIFVVLSILILSISLTTGRHHKKKENGIFGYASSLYSDFVEKIPHHILKFAVKKLTDHQDEDDHSFDAGHLLGNLIYGGGDGTKHKHHHKGHKEVLYKPVYVGHDYLGGPTYGFNDFYQSPNYASIYSNYEPFHGNFPNHLPVNDHFDHLDYNFHHF